MSKPTVARKSSTAPRGQWHALLENITPVTEREMTDAQMKKREEIVKSMKSNVADFKSRYGDRWKEVMYATATKQAMGEDTKPYPYECMKCGNKWRSTESGQVNPVRCPKCGASGEDDILPGVFSGSGSQSGGNIKEAPQQANSWYKDQIGRDYNKKPVNRQKAKKTLADVIRRGMSDLKSNIEYDAKSMYEFAKSLTPMEWLGIFAGGLSGLGPKTSYSSSSRGTSGGNFGGGRSGGAGGGASFESKMMKEADFKDRYGDRWKEVMYATATKMAMGEDSLSEAPETFTVMAIGDPTPSWKRSDYNYKPTAKVLDQMHSLEKPDIVHVAKMFRQKFPKATISVENKGGKIVKVFKPGEMIKEAASIRPIKVGDYVHAGLAVKGGAGFSGRVDKIDGNYVYVNVGKDKSVQFKDDPLSKWGDRIIKAPIKNVSLQEADMPVMSAGARVMVPHKGKKVVGKVVRYDKGDMHGSPFYIVNVGEYESIRVPAESVMKEAEMTGAEKKERERLVKGMKKGDWSRYGERAKEVMYATATKRAMGEDHDEELGAEHDVDAVRVDLHFDDADVSPTDDQDMMLAQLDAIASRARKLHQTLGQVHIDEVPAWIQDKVSIADHNMNAILDYYMFETSTLSEAENAKARAGEVAWFLQPAHLAAKTLNGVDYTPVGVKPEDIINNAILVFLKSSHTTESWKMAGATLNALRDVAGIEWDDSLIKSSLQQAMGIKTKVVKPEEEPEPTPKEEPQAEKPAAAETKKKESAAPKEPAAPVKTDAEAEKKEKAAELKPTTEEVEIEIKLGKPMDKVTFQQKRDAALEFAAATCPGMNPNGVTPEQIINNAVSVWFHQHPMPLDAELEVLGKALEVLSKLGINWDFHLVPAMYLQALKLPNVKVTEIDEKDTSAAGKKVENLEDILIKL